MRDHQRDILVLLEEARKGRSADPRVQHFVQCARALPGAQHYVAFSLAKTFAKRFPNFFAAQVFDRPASDVLIELAKQRGRFIRRIVGIREDSVEVALVAAIDRALVRFSAPAALRRAFFFPERNLGVETAFARVGQGESVRKVFAKARLQKRSAHLVTSGASPQDLDVIAAVRFAQARARGIEIADARAIAASPFGCTFLSARDEARFKVFLDWFAKHTPSDPLVVSEWVFSRQRADKAFSTRGRTARSVAKASARFLSILEDSGEDASSVLEDAAPSGELHELQRGDAIWRFRPLKSAAELMLEAERQKHCVFTYRDDLVSGSSTFFTLERIKDGGVKTCLTLELGEGVISEVRGRCNRVATKEESAIVAEWAKARALTFGGEVELPNLAN